MRVAILGIDGFIGFTLAQTLMNHGHTVVGFDSLIRRELAESIVPIAKFQKRMDLLKVEHGDKFWGARTMDIRHCASLGGMFKQFEPDVIVDLAEIPAAPYSMQSFERCKETTENNVTGTLSLLWAMREACPDAHLIKLGTMGEYGTPGHEIWEGKRDVSIHSEGIDMVETSKLPMPTKPGSFYHASKVMDSVAIDFACRVWGLRCTDVMQGVVYGHSPVLLDTRLDVDESWGTVVHRMCAQALVGRPLSVYGAGGQTRGFLSMDDVMACLQIIAANPPEEGERRVVNQFGVVMSVKDVAKTVVAAARMVFGKKIFLIEHGANPRVEAESHEYFVQTDWLKEHGYELQTPMQLACERLLTKMKTACSPDLVKKQLDIPYTQWK